MLLNDKIVNELGLPCAIVHEALLRLGSQNRYRVMFIKKALKRTYSEAIIKRSINQLVEAGYLEREGEPYDSRGFKYKAKAC
jgi:predicted transcriptional regulator